MIDKQDTHIKNLLAFIDQELRATEHWSAQIKRDVTREHGDRTALADTVSITITYHKPLEREHE